MAAKPGALIRAVLAPLGERLDIDALVELNVMVSEAEPFTGEAGGRLGGRDGVRAAAFHFAYCGANLLLAYRELNAFPAYGKRASKRGAKWVTNSFDGNGGQRATIFLTHALGTFLLQEAGQAGQLREVERQMECLQLLDEQLPLSDDDAQLLKTCCREYDVMVTKRVPEEVEGVVTPQTGYHMALLDSEFAEGKQPDEVPELLQAQQRYASQYLRLMAGLNAIEMAIGPKLFERIEDELIRPGHTQYEGLEYDRGDLYWWRSVVKDWEAFAKIALN